MLKILDKSFKTIATLNNKGNREKITPYFDDEYIQDLTTGAETYSFSTIGSCKNAQYIEVGNYVAFADRSDTIRLFQITEVEEVHEEDYILNVYCEMASIELLNEVVRPMKVVNSNPKKFLETLLNETDWSVGYFDDEILQIIDFEIEQHTTIYSCIQDYIIGKYEGEVAYRVEFDNNKLSKKYIDVFAKRGKEYKKLFYYSKNLTSVKKTLDSSELCTRLIGVGTNNIDFKTVSKPDKPLNQDFIESKESYEKWNVNGSHITGIFKADTDSAEELYQLTKKELENRKDPKITYELKAELLGDETVELGDTVKIIDNEFNTPIRLQARVQQLKTSFTNPDSDEIVLANFKIIESRIKSLSPEEMKADIINQITNLKVGELSESDMAYIKNLLLQLDVNKDKIDEIIKDLYEKYNPELSDEEGENIYIDGIEDGLFIGDDRLYSLKKSKVCNVATVEIDDEQNLEQSTEVTDIQAYQNAVDYYKKFDLGKSKTNANLASVMSSSNKYKIKTMVEYWCQDKFFGVDPQLIYMMIKAESSGNPYQATKYSGGGYGLLQCERDAYFNKKQTIKFRNGTTKTFTPSYNTMNPDKGLTVTVNGVKVNGNINNQIMFGIYEFRKSMETYKYNLFAGLIGYNMGVGACAWILGKYVNKTYGCTWNNQLGLSYLTTATRNKVYTVLETQKAPFEIHRKDWQIYWKSQGYTALGTLKNIEGYLQYYKPVNNSLPYILDSEGNKQGLGYSQGKTKSLPAIVKSMPEVKMSGNKVRDIIVETAKAMVSQHVDEKIATYDQAYRTDDFSKPIRRKGTYYGIKDPICYDCSSFVGSAYKQAGLTSVYKTTCRYGTLVKGATAKSGYSMWKVDDEGIAKAKAGDIVMKATNEVKNPSASYYSQEGKTSHTMIYIGDGKVAHASDWDYHPNAIKISNISYYKNLGTAFFLRPYDLAQADKIAYETNSETNEETTNAIVETTLVAIKALTNATPSSYIQDGKLIETLTIDNETDDIKYPTTCKYVFVDFDDIDDIQTTQNLLLALSDKYKNKPILIARTGNDEFDGNMREFCNKEKNIFLVDTKYYKVPSSTGEILEYYNAVKDSIKSVVIGKIPKPTTPEDSENQEDSTTQPTTPTTPTTQLKNVELTMKLAKTYTYGKVGSIYLKLNSTVNKSFWSKVTFETTASTKFKQSNIVYLEGLDCKNGTLLYQPNTKYTILFMPNTDNSNYNGKKYYGSVTGTRSGVKYPDFKDFKGKADVGKICKTWEDNAKKFKYKDKGNGYSTPASFKNPDANSKKWIVPNTKVGDNYRYFIDCSTFAKFVFMGLTYGKSPYATKTTSLKRNTNYGWSFTLPRLASEQAQYCVEKGWVLNHVDLENFTNLEVGDLIFYDRDGDESNGRYMSISHVAVVYKIVNGVPYTIESTNVVPTIRVMKCCDNTPKKIVMIARVKKY